MSNNLNISTKVECPTWDGERSTFSNWEFKFRAVVASANCSDALDATRMTSCPTKTEYDLLDKLSTDPAVIAKIKLYKENDFVAGYFALGQNSQAGINAIKSTKSPAYPMGLPYLALDKLSRKFNPKDTTAKILMKTRIEGIQLKDAEQYYADVSAVMNEYELVMSDKDLLEIMIAKTGNTTFVKEIRDELKKTTPNFEDTCTEIAALQNLARVKLGTTQPPKQKEVSLSNQSGGSGSGAGGSGKQKCSHCGDAHKRSDCQKLKEALKKQGDCKWCGKKGHLNDTCFVKYPDKKPKWLKLKRSKGTEASASNLEVTLAHVGQDFR